MSQKILQVSGLCKSFKISGPVLENINFEFPLGSRLAIIGPSGCGKSTLLRLLAGMENLEQPCLKISGQPISHLKDLGKISFVFQEANLLPWRNVEDNIALPLELEGLERVPKLISAAIEKVGLVNFNRHFPSQLSGGMKMRVALARALITNPDFIMLDEPFGALDEFTRDQMNSELLDLWQDRKPSTILITHNIEEALFLSDRVLVLSGKPGKVLEVLEVDLPQERSLELKEQEVFWKMRQKLSRLLRSAS